MFGWIAAIGSVLKTGINRWGQVKEAKHEATLAKIKALANVQEIKAQHLASWEQTMAEATKTSWKDQWFTIVLSMPFLLGFIPPLQPFISEGFAFMGMAPAWYQTAFLIAVGASYGVRLFPSVGQSVKGLLKKGE